jgi:hypothetical protein
MVRGQAVASDLHDHLALHKVVDAIYESASRGKDVSIRL